MQFQNFLLFIYFLSNTFVPLLYREEIETPKVWAQICIQRMAELAKESTTMRRVLDPMFVYFDSGRHWVPQQGSAIMVLSDMLYFMENSGILISLRFLPQCVLVIVL